MHPLQPSARRQWSAGRLFAAYAAVTLVPVLLLGFLLTQLLRDQADDRGLSEGVNQARLVARATIAPLLDGDPTTSLAPGELARLQRTVRAAVDEQQVLRLRLRDLAGNIVFPSSEVTDADDADADDDEALEAARGETVAELTRLNADDKDVPPGPRVVEVYLPLTSTQTGQRIGVLEMYLPYAPIAAAVAQGQRTVYTALVAGLALLWLCLIGVTASVIRRLRREARTNAHLASHDPLTGLPNRTRFLAALDQALRTHDQVVVALLNVNRFRQVSDALGKDNADALLVVLADRLHEFTGHSAVARLDGADFGVLAVGLDSDPAIWLQRLRAVVGEPIEIDNLPVALDVTVGYDVRRAPSEADTASADAQADLVTLPAHAAVALSAAKRSSRSLLRYDPEQERHDAAALGLVAEIGRAIDTDQLVLHYQPKYDVRLGRVTSVEALVRWQHDTRGLLYPDAFLEAVEETELIDDLTHWVLTHACRAVRLLDASVRIAVNVSARSLAQPGFAADVIDLVRSERVSANRIILEVTETAVITDPRRARRTLTQLRESGFEISIDDFGVGQTSLSHLVAMPIDELKIDRAFVSGMLDDPRSAAIVRAVIELGHSLGISVTAEGVETDHALSALRALGCDVAQGYHFSRPVPLPQLLQLLGDSGPSRHGERPEDLVLPSA